MPETTQKHNEEVVIDLKKTAIALRERWLALVLVPVMCAVIALAVSLLLVKPGYTAEVMFYVQNKTVENQSISSGDLDSSRDLVESCLVILETRETMAAVIRQANVACTEEELAKRVDAAAVRETELFRVVVQAGDPAEAAQLAGAIAAVLPGRITSVMEGTAVAVADPAVVPDRPSAPNYAANTAVGFLVGLVLIITVIAAVEVCRDVVRTQEDVVKSCGGPVLARVPASGKEDCAETYRLLRTKMVYALKDVVGSPVIGISGAGEADARQTAAGLAQSLARLDKKVILVDCDLRSTHPGEDPGLYGVLTGECSADGAIQICRLTEPDGLYCRIPAGKNTPSAPELVASEEMTALTQQLRESFDYVLLNLPPVVKSSETVAVASYADGMLLTVNANRCRSNTLMEAVERLAYVDAKLLGAVLNG